VHGHGEPFVRRAALLAAAQVLGAMPPARLAGALLGQERDAGDRALVERLQWLHSWLTAAGAHDADDSCRLLAQGCAGLHASLAERALQSVGALPEGGLSLGALGRGGGTAPAVRLL